MFQTGGFWADEDSPREHCYKVVPLDIANDAREMTLHGFERVYHALGGLGYRFRDAGHNSEYAIISLRTPISSGHKKQLAEKFGIFDNDGVELSSI